MLYSDHAKRGELNATLSRPTGYEMIPEIVTLGVVTTDLLLQPIDALPPRGQLAFVSNLEMRMGGLAGVCAAVASQLGAMAAFIGKVGMDGLGAFVLDTLRKYGVMTDLVVRTQDHATSATMVLIAADGERTFLHHIGANGAITDGDIPWDAIRGAKVLHWAGPAIMPGLQGKPIGKALRKARELGITTSMDTCFDGSGVWFPHIEHALPELDIVMSSLEEARHYTGKHEPDAIADFYLSFGPKTVVIKLGDQGLLAVDRSQRIRLPAHRVPVVDTTGAGDAACAGFLYGHTQGWDLERSAGLANAVGGLTVQAFGGCDAGVTLERAMALMESDS